VLDAVQARAVPCSHLFLIGAVHGAWPRELADDPFLPDRIRKPLRATLRRPVPLRGSAGAEERSLFGLLLAQTRARVSISWAERDAQGRTLSPSALLRNLPFIAPGTDVVEMQPSPALESFARAPAAWAAHDAAVAAGHLQLACIEDPQGHDLSFDGAVGADALAALGALAPTFLEGLGRCALRAFFDHVLRARELEQPGSAGLDDAESGRFVHAVLDELYGELGRRGALAPGASAPSALALAAQLLPAALERAAAQFRGDMQKRHPRLFEAYLDAMAASIHDFLQRDLGALLPSGVASIESERDVSARIDVGGGAALAVEGRIDRIVRRPDGSLRVGDYKTGAFKKQLARLEIRRGRSLQLPLYTLAIARSRATESVSAEVLPVPRHPQRDRDEARAEERSMSLADLEALAIPALAELERLLTRGDFPFRSDEIGCARCPHTVGCRYAQPESEARSRAAPARESYFALEERRS
jgi:RecB family exonuclease